jgi:uncharacterized protein (TIGR00730 family)
MSQTSEPVVCVFGSYAPRKGEPLYRLAYEIGHALAKAGYCVANGGYDGTMEASHRGAKEAGGRTVGITCSIFGGYRAVPLKANCYCDQEIHYDNVMQRIDRMMQMSAAYIFLEGGTGTLSELGLAWEYVAKGLIEPRPIFIVGEFWRPMAERLIAVRPKSGRHLHFVERADEIVSILRRNNPSHPRPSERAPGESRNPSSGTLGHLDDTAAL